MPPEFRTIRYAVDAHVATITLNRPERKNAIGPEMANELVWALDEARDDAEVRVVVLTGAGNVFSAGGDLGGMSAGGEPLAMKGDFADLLVRLAELGKPTIARVPGPAMGGGCGLVASCTFAIAAESAVLGTPEIKRGLFPFMILAPLARVVRRRDLLELILLGEKISAARAKELGILSQVVADDALDATVADLAKRLAAQSPTAMRLGLRAFYTYAEVPLAESVPKLRDELAAILGTADAQEGLRAFLEKREPNFTGR
jgi:enoyl-CoA hydratase/carnithine racemase